MAVFDCFPFLNELDLLEIRLYELDPIVDVFVLCEARLTHSFQPKALNFEANRDRFAPYASKIRYVVLDSFQNADSWSVEPEQRVEAVRRSGAGADDVIIASDVDEIPRRSSLVTAIGELRATGKPQTLDNRLYFYGFDCAALSEWEVWPGASVTYRRDIEDASEIRGQRKHFVRHKNAGWHYSNFGTPEQILYKLQSFAAHANFPQELAATDRIVENIQKLQSPYDCPRKFQLLPGHDDVPELVRAERGRYSQHFLAEAGSATA
jgi:beta-1,4-mannosyl-glycoprotein beta-1,4-N-acetylglucosaminyltransferase